MILSMLRSLLCFFFFIMTTVNLLAQDNRVLQILVVTGGHEFEHEPFFAMFKADGIQCTELVQPKANDAFADGSVMKYDVVVLYDLWQEINDKQKEGYVNYLKSGKGLVALHHCLGSYQKWDEFIGMVGGTYVMDEKPRILGDKTLPPSNYQHDVTLPIQIVDFNHPVTKGIQDFELFDELYGSLYVQDDVHILLKTANPKSSPVIGWAKMYDKARVVCLQPGHGQSAFNDPNYRRLVQQSIRWTAMGKE